MEFELFRKKMNGAARGVLALNGGVVPTLPVCGRDFVGVLQKAAQDAGFERPTPELLFAIRDLASATNPVTSYALPKLYFEQRTGKRVESGGNEFSPSAARELA